jgi:hypothetical protein
LEEVDGFFVRSEFESMGGYHEFSDTAAFAQAHSSGYGTHDAKSSWNRASG